MTTNNYGMLLDRGLTVELLDLALAVSATDPSPKTNRRSLTVALRDFVSDQEAEGKTKKCLTRVWLNPPVSAHEMISWARGADVAPEARGLFHFGAVLATFPFAGVVARIVGQHLATEGGVSAFDVRSEVRRALGDRSSVDVAARKSYTTFRNLGLLRLEDKNLLPVASQPTVPGPLAPWLAHAILLTRSADSLPTTSLRNAPELLGVKLPGTIDRAYPLLETHAQVGGAVLARRC